MSQDFVLRASSEQALTAALESAGVAFAVLATVDADGAVLLPAQKIQAAPGYALDVIGVISKRTGGTDESPIMQQIDGFHANLRGELTEEQKAKLPTIAAPNNPVRVWF